jgi:hypothetical protein
MIYYIVREKNQGLATDKSQAMTSKNNQGQLAQLNHDKRDNLGLLAKPKNGIKEQIKDYLQKPSEMRDKSRTTGKSQAKDIIVKSRTTGEIHATTSENNQGLALKTI